MIWRIQHIEEGGYPPKASVDNILLDLQDSSYPTRPHSVILLIIHACLARLIPTRDWGFRITGTTYVQSSVSRGIWHVYYSWTGWTDVLSSLRASSLGGALWQRGRKRRESLQLRLWNLNICIKKVNEKCWLAEMTLLMMSLPLTHVFLCSFTFALVSASPWLAEIWQLSLRGPTGELELNSNSRDVVASSASFSCPTARVPQGDYLRLMFLACGQALWGVMGAQR